jgi:hypothetical protein
MFILPMSALVTGCASSRQTPAFVAEKSATVEARHRFARDWWGTTTLRGNLDPQKLHDDRWDDGPLGWRLTVVTRPVREADSNTKWFGPDNPDPEHCGDRVSFRFGGTTHELPRKFVKSLNDLQVPYGLEVTFTEDTAHIILRGGDGAGSYKFKWDISLTPQ